MRHADHRFVDAPDQANPALSTAARSGCGALTNDQQRLRRIYLRTLQQLNG